MDFIKQPNTSISRTVYEADIILFRTLLNQGGQKEEKFVNPRLLVMMAIGILNRTFNLEEYLVAVIGQRWNFKRLLEVGETISTRYQIHKNINFSDRKYIYDIKIELIGDGEVVAEGIWEIMLKYKILERG